VLVPILVGAAQTAAGSSELTVSVSRTDLPDGSDGQRPVLATTDTVLTTSAPVVTGGSSIRPRMTTPVRHHGQTSLTAAEGNPSGRMDLLTDARTGACPQQSAPAKPMTDGRGSPQVFVACPSRGDIETGLPAAAEVLPRAVASTPLMPGAGTAGRGGLERSLSARDLALLALVPGKRSEDDAFDREASRKEAPAVAPVTRASCAQDLDTGVGDLGRQKPSPDTARRPERDFPTSSAGPLEEGGEAFVTETVRTWVNWLFGQRRKR
jgi:hypothetical protein